jgi:hypothetical protein
MRRTAIAAAWIAGTTVPLLAAVVFVFGCCVLPFHGYIHRPSTSSAATMGIPAAGSSRCRRVRSRSR